MPNTWFQFKQFLIRQEGSAMKVGTDSVILGAWVSVDKVHTALDVGAGTGILSLMLAQRMPGLIDAVELDENASRQAQENVENSPWRKRIRIIHDSFQHFASTASRKYDLVISNPPFFNKSHKAGFTERTLARHTSALPWEKLINGSANVLNEEGRLAVIIPGDDYNLFSRLAEIAGLKPQRLLKVFPKPGAPVKRIAVEYSFHDAQLREEELIIEKGERHNYTDGYRKLTHDFYLNKNL